MKSYLIKDTTKEERAGISKKLLFITSVEMLAIRRCYKDCETIYRSVKELEDVQKGNYRKKG